MPDPDIVVHHGPCETCGGNGYIIVDTSTENELAQDTDRCWDCDGSGEAFWMYPEKAVDHA